MPLHLEHRPDKLDDVIGNKGLVQKLGSLLNKKSKPHSYLFHGPSGCGKTTLGRILMKELGCESGNIQEVNASNNRGIDTMRDIIAGLKYKPMNGSKRGFILDEFHQTTKDAQNAILKALEDTPGHIFFVLCTTDPQKLLTTVRNRCSTFEVRKLEEEELFTLLKKVSRKEKKRLSKEVLEQIAEYSDGCPRQSLVILDQIIDLSAEEQLKNIKDIKDQEAQTIDLCRALLKNESWKRVAKILSGIQEDPEKVRWAVMGYMKSVVLKSKNQQASLVFECFAEPFYNSGMAGLVFACDDVINGGTNA